MFNKALFKQSYKANGTMWTIVTFALCFMLACVMLISGSGNIGEVKNAIQDTIITKEIDAQLEKRALYYYKSLEDGLIKFDELFVKNSTETISYLSWLSSSPKKETYLNESDYYQALALWNSNMPEIKTSCGIQYVEKINVWKNEMPIESNYLTTEEYLIAIDDWNKNTPLSSDVALSNAYSYSIDELKLYINELALSMGYETDSTESNELLGVIMFSINPNGLFNDYFIDNGEELSDDYNVVDLVNHIVSGDISNYLLSNERNEYRKERSFLHAPIFLSSNMMKEENVNNIIDSLSNYGINKEKYESFGYTYDSIKHLSNTAIVTYQGRIEYELSLIDSNDYLTNEEYLNAIKDKKEELSNDISSSFLSTLPSTVSEALEEIGKADLYTLIVGSIFYKLAGLLLPIIYMIMTSNNLIAGQVDSGSMAYVLSTSTKRKEIVFTQAAYLIGSLCAMFICTTLTGIICLSLVSTEVTLTYGNLLLLNLGAFLVLFALSGLCFFTSCYFDRSKRSIAIGGGLSIFALVAAMLGLFGSPAIPSVIRLTSLNYFNYVTIISLFDVISIIDGNLLYIYKFIALFVLGIIGYLLGSKKFIKKDLPL